MLFLVWESCWGWIFVCFWGITGDGDLGEHWDFSQPGYQVLQAPAATRVFRRKVAAVFCSKLLKQIEAVPTVRIIRGVG